nr:MAG TPA: hypothetical protein [Caudoviricetes sp.]
MVNAIIIFSYFWSAFIILEIVNNRIHKHCSKTLRTGASGSKFQRIYSYRIYPSLRMWLRIIIRVCLYIYTFWGAIILAKYIWTHTSF